MHLCRLIDTHAHIYLDEFLPDNQQFIERAQTSGVEKIFMPNIDLTSIEPMLAMEEKYPDICFPMMGLHPCYVQQDAMVALKTIQEWLDKRRFSAVGEIGLDYHWDKSNIDLQKQAFEQQVIWALELDLPVVIHSRKSLEDCISIIKKHQRGKLRGIFHCFSGSLEEAKKIEGLGFLMGIGGVITYKNAGVKEVVKHIPLASLVLETDAPYLTPVPFRGKRNEPAYLEYVVDTLAEAKEMAKEKVAHQTTQNALKLFGHSD
jgi:TatD DNase family protein